LAIVDLAAGSFFTYDLEARIFNLQYAI